MWMDRLGGVASAACAAHCLLLSLAPSLVSMLGIELLANELFEWGFFALAVGFALAAALIGYRVHRTGWILAGFGVGLLVLLAGRLGEALALYEGGGVIAVIGGALLASCHVASLRRSRPCTSECCP